MAKLKRPAVGPVPKEALEYFRAKGLKPRFSYLDVWKEEHTYAFTVAKVLERDLLDDVRESLEKSLEEGGTFAEWKKQIKPVLNKSGWSNYGSESARPRRLDIIYRTNMRVARAAGQWDRVQRTKEVAPNLMYVLGPSERHREQHVAWAGTILPADDPFWDQAYPPNGFGCNCGTIQLTSSATEKRGGVSESPSFEYDEWVHPKTGVREMVPRGIQPGWNYNPGKERAERMKELEDEET